jgi:WD40 repeat protein
MYARFLAVALLAMLVFQSASSQESKTASMLSSKPAQSFGSRHLHHGSRIQSLVFVPAGAFPESPNDALLVAGGGNDPVRVWNPQTGQLVKSIDAPWAQALAWNVKDKSLALGTAFRSVKIVKPAGPAEDLKHDNAPASILALAMSLEGKPILVACQDGQLLLYYPSNRKAIALPGHKGEVNALAATPNGKLFASGGADRTIQLWKLGGELDVLEKTKSLSSPGMVHALAFTPDGERLISAGDGRGIQIWDVATGKVLHTLDGHKDTVTRLALSPDGKTLVSISYDQSAIVWNLQTREKLRTVPIRFGDADALALSPDAKFFAVAGGNNVIRLFETETGKEKTFAPGPSAPLVRAVYVPATSRLIGITNGGDVHQWDAKTAEHQNTWSLKTPAIVQTEILCTRSPNEAVLLTGSSAMPAVEIWDTAAGRSLGTIPLPAGEVLTGLAFAPSGKTVALGFQSGLLHLVDWPSREVRAKGRSAGPLRHLEFCPEAPVLAAATRGKVQLWDVPTGQTLRHFLAKEDTPENQQPVIADLAFSPNGKAIAVSGYDGVIRLVDWTTGKFLTSCEGHTSAAESIAFAPDGRTLASGSFDKTVRLWEAFTGKCIEVLKDHDGPVAAVAFAPNGRTIYSASADGRALMWDPSAPIFEKAGKIDAGEQQKLWDALANEAANVGQSASWRWASSPGETPDVLRSKVYLLDPKKVDQLFVDLDAREFVVREKATQELEKYGRWMEGRLETALQDPPSLEVKRRIERMIGALRIAGAITLKQERLRMLRVMQVLEQIGDEKARETLDALAKGAAEPELQREAELSLKRLQKRAG